VIRGDSLQIVAGPLTSVSGRGAFALFARAYKLFSELTCTRSRPGGP
jgi:hypothetical protein